MGNFITYSDLSSDAPSFNAIRGMLDLLFLRRNNNPTPLDWAALVSSAYPHTTNSLVDIGNCIGAIAQYLYQDIGMPTPDIEQLISRGAYKSAFSFPDPVMEALYASTGSTFDMTWWNGNHGQSPIDYSLANIEIAFGLTTGSLQDAAAGQAFVPTGQQQQQRGGGGLSGIGGVLQTSSSNNFAGMSGLTAYNLVDSDFITARLQIDSQTVKQTVQGVVDEFTIKTDELSLKANIQQNDPMLITETVYQGEINSLQNYSFVSTSKADPSDPRTWKHRFIFNSGAASVKAPISANNILSSSVFDQLVAIGVDDIRPFCIKNLDINHTAELHNDNPTNDVYINHLTPVKDAYIAKLQFSNALWLQLGIKEMQIHYDAIDLTGQVVAGTDIEEGTFQQNTDMLRRHISGHNGYLVVKKTVPCFSQIIDFQGSIVTIAEALTQLAPLITGPPLDESLFDIKITSPGGIVNVPTKDFKRPIVSNVMKNNNGGEYPTPYIDVSDCVVSVKDSIKGYGRPKRVDNTVLVDQSNNSSNHLFTVETNTGEDLTNHKLTTNIRTVEQKRLPNTYSRATHQVFEIIDNNVTQNEHELLIMPKNKKRSAALDDLRTRDTDVNSNICSIEMVLLDGRAEEIEIDMANGEGELMIRGRSKLMDLVDSEVQRNLNLGEAIPIKEIGDLGTPTVSLTLGGLGQGGIDTISQFEEHSYLQGWKDKIVSSDNPSIRNDKQTSTYYASTRALVELPLFPSMFFDVEELYKIIDGVEDGRHAEGKEFSMTLDCTMTAKNRPQMQHYEARNAVDWGFKCLPAIELKKDLKNNDLRPDNSYGLRVGKGNIQAVITGHDLTIPISAFHTPSAYIQVDDAEAFVNEANINFTNTQKSHVIVGEGIIAPTARPDLTYCSYLHFRVVNADNTLNRLYVDQAFIRMPREDILLDIGGNLGGGFETATSYMFTGATVQLGGVIVNENTNIGPSAHTGTLKCQMDAFGVGGLLTTRRDALVTQLSFALGLDTNKFVTRNSSDNLRGDFNFIYMLDHDIDILQWDIFQEYGTDNNRILKEPIICYTDYLGLKGHSERHEPSGEMANLNYVVPFRYSFRDIAVGAVSFDECVDELIRRINMAGVPEAKFSNGRSAFRTFLKDDFSTFDDEGSHLGYARAFRGKAVESKSGEKGFTIVIHSTVPGAAGRNFAVWLENNSYYPYNPIQAFGYGGLLATNSRSYQTNSFPAPLPIGSDGETFVPITTFTGSPHGSLTHHLDSTETLRKYNGIGQRYVVTTKASTVHGTAYGVIGNNLDRVTIDSKFLEYLQRSGWDGSQGYARVGGILATFTDFGLPFILGAFPDGEAYMNLLPLDGNDDLKEQFFQGTNEVVGIDIEIIYPPIDREAILFFGGGHTGLVFDIADGSKNDYTSFYKHLYAGSLTEPFAGFMNVGEMQRPSAVLDFTEITNEDTINDNTLRGIHHKTYIDTNGNPKGWCNFYARLTNGLGASTEDITISSASQGGSNSNPSEWVEDIYGVPLRMVRNASMASGPGITNGIEGTSVVLDWDFPCAVHVSRIASNVATSEHGELTTLDPTSGSWAISAIMKPGAVGQISGPVFHSIYDDGTNVGKPYGLHIGGSTPAGNLQQIQIALSHYTSSGLLDASLLTPLGIPGIGLNSISIDTTGWTFVMIGRDNTANQTFCYIGNTVGITNPADGVVTAGIFDFTDHITVTADTHYGTVNPSPNAQTTFETRQTGYLGGTADHPVAAVAVPYTVGGSFNNRNVGQHTIGGALLGAPYVRLHGTSSQGGVPNLNFHNYFTDYLISSSLTPTYGRVTGGGNGLNNAGPISFSGFLSEVGVFHRKPSFTEAQEWFASYQVW